MRIASLAYVPPPRFPGSEVFLENLKKFPAKHELMLYSEHPYEGAVKIKKDPEEYGRGHKWGVNNAVFMTGLQLARKAGFTHIIYLESDCRVGVKNWDDIIFEEFFGMKFPYICAGTLVCWNPSNGNLEVGRRWERLIADKNKRRNFPIATYGVPDHGDPFIFPNGALGVYDMEWMNTLFDLPNMYASEFAKTEAWDHQLGKRIWKRFGVQSFDMVAHLDSVYSGYMDRVTTLDERLAMLRSGEICAGHQFKGTASI